MATVRTHRPISAGHVQSLALVVCRCPELSEKVETEVDGGGFDSVCRMMVLPYSIVVYHRGDIVGRVLIEPSSFFYPCICLLPGFIMSALIWEGFG